MNLQPNPIVTREARARWRGGRPFVLMLGYASLLAGIISFAYGWTVLDPVSAARQVRHSSIIGHELFLHLMWVQTLAWMLLGPALTAPVIAGERERGLLEGLQLAPLSPWRIVLGKLGAAIAFMAMLLLVPLPIVAICFLLGGVSPGELWLSILLQVSVAIFGASLGLACSSRSHRSGAAFTSTFTIIILWGLGSGAALVISTIPVGVINLWPGVRELCELFALTNPITSALAITNQNFSGQVVPTGTFSLLLVVPPGTVCIGFCWLMSLLLLWVAARAVRKPLPEQHWVEWKPSAGKTTRRDVAQRAPSVGADGQQRQAGPRTRARWELPLLARLRFANPVLQRELRSRTRLRQPSKVHRWVQGALLLILIYAYYRLLAATISDPMLRGALWQMEAVLTVIGVLLASALMGANTLSREREAGTWEAVNLSLLTPWQIISGKLFVIMMTCGAWVALILPLLLSCIDFHYANRMDDIAPPAAALSFLLLGVTAWCYGAFGMLLSWLCRRSITAISWTVVSLVLLLCFVPIMIEVLELFADSTPVLAYWHPAFTMGYLGDVGWNRIWLPIVLAAICFYFVSGCAIIALLSWLIRRGIRERDGSFAAPAADEAGVSSTAMVAGRT